MLVPPGGPLGVSDLGVELGDAEVMLQEALRGISLGSGDVLVMGELLGVSAARRLVLAGLLRRAWDAGLAAGRRECR